MEFYLSGKKVIWKGLSWVSDDPLTVGQLKCLVASTQEAYICHLEKIDNIESPTILENKIPGITEVVQEYCDLFEDPCGLPPHR